MFEEILSNIETIGNVSVVVAYGILALIHWRLRAIDSRLRSTARRHQLRTHRGLIVSRSQVMAYTVAAPIWSTVAQF